VEYYTSHSYFVEERYITENGSTNEYTGLFYDTEEDARAVAEGYMESSRKKVWGLMDELTGIKEAMENDLSTR